MSSIAKLCGNRSRRASSRERKQHERRVAGGDRTGPGGRWPNLGVGHPEYPNITPHAQTAPGLPSPVFSEAPPLGLLALLGLAADVLAADDVATDDAAAVLSSRTRRSSTLRPRSCSPSSSASRKTAFTYPRRMQRTVLARIRAQTCEQHVRDAVVRAICLGALAGRSGILPGDRQNPPLVYGKRRGDLQHEAVEVPAQLSGRRRIGSPKRGYAASRRDNGK
jgi:hypothetical protein